MSERLRDVEVFVDRGGVPHVLGRTQSAAYFGQGYVAASIRLWQLDLLRRTATGRLSECFGSRTLTGDIFQRTLGLERLVARALPQIPDDARERMLAYCEGVNHYTENNKLPPEFDILSTEPEPWSPVDVLRCAALRSIVNASFRADLVFLKVIGRAGAERARDLFARYGMPDGGAEWREAGNYDEPSVAESLRLIRASEDALRLVGLHHVDTGSNTWAVDGTRTESGRPLLANDLHMGFVIPNPSFLVRLKAPGLDVRGISIPGIPGVVVGHNERIAWGSTALMADAQDLFIEELDEETKHYRYRGEWLPVEEWEEEIRVRDADSLRLPVRFTHHGPVIELRGRYGLALRWERLDTPPGDPTFHALNTARDWPSFRDALRGMSLPPTDFTYADVDGNVGAQSAGWVPIRAAGDGAVPVPGSEGAFDWTGYIAFEDLPSQYAPAEGVVVRANQNHDEGACGRFLSRRWHPPYRARRIRDLVNSAKRLHTVESFAEIQFDRFSAHAFFVGKRIAASADASEHEAAADLLRRWDGKLDPESAAASLAKECSALLKDQLLRPVLGKRLLFEYQQYWPAAHVSVERILDEEDPGWLPEGVADYPSLYRSVLEKALANLQRAFGSKDFESWRWGWMNRARFAHPLENVPFFGNRFRVPAIEVGADGECVFSARSVSDYISSQQSAMLEWGSGRGAIFGASARLIWDLADWNNSSMLLNLGQSADPRSPHYRDHLELWRTGRTQKLPFTWDRVVASSMRLQVLETGDASS
jgi:penicillin amidase